MKWPIPIDGNSSPAFQVVRPSTVPPHSFCQIFLPMAAFWAPLSELAAGLAAAWVVSEAGPQAARARLHKTMKRKDCTTAYFHDFRRNRKQDMDKIPWDQVFSFTPKDAVKLFITALVIVLVTKVQLFSDRLSALLIALPFTSLVAMFWMQAEKQPAEKIANHAEGTFWFVLPTLPMFLILPWMLRHGWGFWVALGVNCLLTVGFFWLTVVVLRRFGINLM